MFFWEHANYPIGNVSIVSYFAHKLLIILKTNKTNPNAHLHAWDLVVKYIIGALIQHSLFSQKLEG